MERRPGIKEEDITSLLLGAGGGAATLVSGGVGTVGRRSKTGALQQQQQQQQQPVVPPATHPILNPESARALLREMAGGGAGAAVRSVITDNVAGDVMTTSRIVAEHDAGGKAGCGRPSLLGGTRRQTHPTGPSDPFQQCYFPLL